MVDNRIRSINNRPSVHVTDAMYDLLDKYVLEILTPVEKLNDKRIGHSEQIMRIVGLYLYDKEEHPQS